MRYKGLLYSAFGNLYDGGCVTGYVSCFRFRSFEFMDVSKLLLT